MNEAIKNGKLKTLKSLIKKKKINVNEALSIEDGRNDTPLGYACKCGQEEIVSYLVKDAKADIEKRNADGATPFYLCCRDNQPACAKVLVDLGADVEASMDGGWTPLATAAWKGNQEIVQLLLEHNADKNKPVDDGETPLMIATEFGFPEIVKLLLDSGAEVDIQQEDGQTALHMAVYKGNNAAVPLLLEAGCAVDIRDNGGFTALCRVGESPANYETYHALWAFGADISASGWNGNTCLHLAAANGKESLFWAIFAQEKGFSKEKIACLTPNAMGFTADQLAELKGHKQLAELMRNRFKTAAAPPPEKTSPAAFMEESSKLLHTIDLERVNLVPRETFLAQGRFYHFDNCHQQGFHLTAGEVHAVDVDASGRNRSRNNRVLFVSHRWATEDEPDPAGDQFALARRFLEDTDAGRSITHVWLDYSCIQQDRGALGFRAYLENVPTAIACADVVLLLPRVEYLPHTTRDGVRVAATDLNDYLGRAWCTLEWSAALLCRSQVFATFQLGQSVHFQSFASPEAAGASVGFRQSYLDVFNPLLDSKDVYAPGIAALYKLWQCNEPCRILYSLQKLSDRVKSGAKSELAVKVATMAVEAEDVEKDAELGSIYVLLGSTVRAEEKLIVFNLLVFIGLFFSGALANVEIEPEPVVEQEVEADPVLDSPPPVRTVGGGLKKAFVCMWLACAAYVVSAKLMKK